MNDILAGHFQAIRSRIESDVKKHSIIMVTSATAEDGARLTSFGLAECLAAAGHQTALVDAITSPADAADGRFKTVGRKDFPIYSLPRDSSASARARDAIDLFARQTREAFDYTIIDAPPFGRQGVTQMLANVADVVVISLLIGRQPLKADDIMVRAISGGGAHILGVVGVEAASIKFYEEFGASEYVKDPHTRVATPAALDAATGIPQVRVRQAR